MDHKVASSGSSHAAYQASSPLPRLNPSRPPKPRPAPEPAEQSGASSSSSSSLAGRFKAWDPGQLPTIHEESDALQRKEMQDEFAVEERRPRFPDVPPGIPDAQFDEGLEALLKALDSGSTDTDDLTKAAAALGAQAGVNGEELVARLASAQADPGYQVLQAATVAFLKSLSGDYSIDLRHALEFLVEDIAAAVPAQVVGKMAAAYLAAVDVGRIPKDVVTALTGLMTASAPPRRHAWVAAALFDCVPPTPPPGRPWDDALEQFKRATRDVTPLAGNLKGETACGLVISVRRRDGEKDALELTEQLRGLARDFALHSEIAFLEALDGAAATDRKSASWR